MALAPDPPTIYKINSDCSAADLAGETVILQLSQAQYHGLGESGTFIWHLLEDGASFTDLVEQLASRYDVEKEVLSGDVGAFLQDLLKNDLVVEVQAPSSPVK